MNKEAAMEEIKNLEANALEIETSQNNLSPGMAELNAETLREEAFGLRMDFKITDEELAINE